MLDLIQLLREFCVGRRPAAEGINLCRRQTFVEPPQAFEYDLRPLLFNRAARRLHVRAEVERRVGEREREVDRLDARECADLCVHQLAVLDEEDAVAARVVYLESARLALVAEELD